MESLLPLLFILVFVLLRLLGGRKQQAGPRLPGPSDARSDVEMDEALRQIRQALGMPAPPPAPRAQAPEPVRAPAPRPVLPPRPVIAPRTLPPRIPAPPRNLPPGPAPQSGPATPKPGVPAADPAKPLLDALNAPDAAGQAFLLAEILGPPRSKQRA